MTPTPPARPDLLGLGERVEKASGPDRELDALIRAAVFAPAGSIVEQSKINGAWCVYHGDDSAGRPRPWEPRGLSQEQRLGSFTASLDAAMTLVPEGCAVMVDWHHIAGRPRLSIVHEAYVQRVADGTTIGGSDGSTPALALTAACLRARAALAHQPEGGE